MQFKYSLNIPPGMRDWLPGEACRKREMINRMLKSLALWGYEEINTPVMEYYQVLQAEENLWGPDHLYKLIDRDGKILALRPEMTAPIARVVSSKLPEALPWRLMYGGEVFRYEEIQTGKQRQFCQVGVEMIGSKGAEADSEILALAIETLRSASLNHFTISLGHTGFLSGLLTSLSGEKVHLEEVRTLILEKDFVGLSSCLLNAGIKKERVEGVINLLTCKLPPAELKSQRANLPSEILEAFDDLQKIIEYLKVYGYDHYIQIDLSTLRSQEYYTGMVFEIYTAGIGYPIGGGGRYDQLLRHFGKEYPATGFALGVDRILLSLSQEENGKRQKVILLAGTEAEKVIQKAFALRKKGLKVITEVRKLTRLEAAKLAHEKGAILNWYEKECWHEEEC